MLEPVRKAFFKALVLLKNKVYYFYERTRKENFKARIVSLKTIDTTKM
jgi:hypothetical protein